MRCLRPAFYTAAGHPQNVLSQMPIRFVYPTESDEGSAEETEMIYRRGCNKKGPNGTCKKCGERGSCGVYWYKFMWQGKLIRESTHQGNDKVARQMESAYRTSLAKGEVGIRDKKASPTLAEFMESKCKPWVEATFYEKQHTKIWYLGGVRRLSEFAPL